METPFQNDMFSMVYQAFKNLYPDKEADCQWAPEIPKDEDGNDVLGVTTFADNGRVYVDISANLQVVDAVEIFAHELAHVAAGEEANHGKAWEDAFDAIHKEFNRIGDEIFDDKGVAVNVISGKLMSKITHNKRTIFDEGEVGCLTGTWRRLLKGWNGFWKMTDLDSGKV